MKRQFERIDEIPTRSTMRSSVESPVFAGTLMSPRGSPVSASTCCRTCNVSQRELDARPLRFQMKRCLQCQEEFYCSVACQRSDWKRHKSECLSKARKLDQHAQSHLQHLREHAAVYASVHAGWNPLKVRGAGALFLFGSGMFGVLGKGDSTEKNEPLPSRASNLPSSIVQVAVGCSHVACCTQDGQLCAFGLNDRGQLGFSDRKQINEPHSVPALDTKIVTSVAVGLCHSVVTTSDGEALSFGVNEFGQLGLNFGSQFPAQPAGTSRWGTQDHFSPKLLKELTRQAVSVIQVACGDAHTLCLSSTGEIYAFGDDSRGAVGCNSPVPAKAITKDRSSSSSSSSVIPNIVWVPTRLDTFALTPVVQVAAGNHHSLCVTATGSLYSWGLSKHGAVGLGHEEIVRCPSRVKVLMQIDGEPSSQYIVWIAAGGSFSAAVSVQGQLFSWGSNSHGQLGIGTKEDHFSPAVVPFDAESTRISRVFCGMKHTACVTVDDRIYTWGAGDCGQLGHGDFEDSLSPRLLNTPLLVDPFLSRYPKVIDISCGSDVTAVILDVLSPARLPGLPSSDVTRTLAPVASSEPGVSDAGCVPMAVDSVRNLCSGASGSTQSDSLRHQDHDHDRDRDRDADDHFDCVTVMSPPSSPAYLSSSNVPDLALSPIAEDGLTFGAESVHHLPGIPSLTHSALEECKHNGTGDAKSEEQPNASPTSRPLSPLPAERSPPPVAGSSSRLAAAAHHPPVNSPAPSLLTFVRSFLCCHSNEHAISCSERIPLRVVPLIPTSIAPPPFPHQAFPSLSQLHAIAPNVSFPPPVCPSGTAMQASSVPSSSDAVLVQGASHAEAAPAVVPTLLASAVSTFSDSALPLLEKKKCATDVIVEHIPTHRLDDVETKLRPVPSLPPVNQFRPRRWLPRVPLPTTFQYPVFTAKIRACRLSGDFTDLVRYIQQIVSVPTVLNSSFLPSCVATTHHTPTAQELRLFRNGIDSVMVERFFKVVISLGRPALTTALENSVRQCLRVTLSHLHSTRGVFLTDEASFRFLCIILQNPLNSRNLEHNLALFSDVCGTIQRLPSIAVDRLREWLTLCYPADIFGARLVAMLVTQLRVELRKHQMLQDADDYIVALVRMLRLLKTANDHASLISAEKFYIKEVGQCVDMALDYVKWSDFLLQPPSKAQLPPFTFCNNNFLLDPLTKSHVLQLEYGRMQFEQQFLSAVPMLELRVRRSHFMEDVLSQLSRLSPFALKKRLKVEFVGEQGVDGGGLTQELFELVTRELMKESYGLFIYNQETRTFWYDTRRVDSSKLSLYRTAGIIVGTACYQGVSVNANFPLSLYKKLLGQKVTLEDLKIADPELGVSLQRLLDYDGADVEEVFCVSFAVTRFDERQPFSVDLIPGGSDIPVNNENRHEYVKLYVDYILNKSVKAQAEAFAEGFLSVCDGLALRGLNFTPQELELIIGGTQHLDFRALRRSTRYEGFNPDSPLIRWFWDIIINQFSAEQRRQLLVFCTGSARSPLGGLKELVLTIQRAGPDSNMLPTAHVCFHTLLIPEYSSEQQLKSRLAITIAHAEGFGLQ